MQDLQYEASKANMVACPNCGRTFNPDRIVTHQRICTKTSQGKGAGGGAGASQPGAGTPIKNQSGAADLVIALR